MKRASDLFAEFMGSRWALPVAVLIGGRLFFVLHNGRGCGAWRLPRLLEPPANDL